MEKVCLDCGERIFGRSDKRFCNDLCRNAYHNKEYSDQNKIMRNVNNVLRKNRKILGDLLSDRGERQVVPKIELQELGFNFGYVTHARETAKGNAYLFCYDVAYQVMEDEQVLILNRENIT